MNTTHSRPVRGLVRLLVFAALAGLLACRNQTTTAPGVVEEVPRASVSQVRQWMEQGDRIAFLDARSEASWLEATTQIPGSIRVPPGDVASHLDEIPRMQTIVAYCT